MAYVPKNHPKPPVPAPLPRHEYAIGIDPDKDKNGVALWSIREKKMLELLKLSQPDTIRYCEHYRETGLVYLEAGHEINYIWGLGAGWSKQKCASKGRDVGCNHGAAYTLLQWFEDLAIPYVCVQPTKALMAIKPEHICMSLGYEVKDPEKLSAARLVLGL